MGLFFAPIANVILSSVRSERGGASLGRQQRDPGARRRVRGRDPRVRVLALRRLPQRPAFVDGMTPAVYVGAAVVALGSVASFSIRRRPKPDQVVGRDGLRAAPRSERPHRRRRKQRRATAPPGPGQLDPGRDGAAQLAAVAHCDQGGGAGENLPPPGRSRATTRPRAAVTTRSRLPSIDSITLPRFASATSIDRRRGRLPRPGVRDDEVANAPPLDPHGDDEADAHADDHSLRRRRGRREQHDRAVISRPRRECSPRRDHHSRAAVPDEDPARAQP